MDKVLDNKKVVNNTIVLYIRTVITLCISLYSSRVVLDILGVNDFGVYTVIAGFVSMFSVIGGTMISATQRFLSFEIGKLNNNHTKEYFSTAIIIHCFLCLITLVLFETIGVWFLNEKLNIDSTRLYAANWLYQFSVLTFLLNLIRTPFDALIIAYEKMKIFAYVNVLEAILRLLILYLLLLGSVDYLIMYGIYLFFVAVIIFILYYSYVKVKLNDISFIIIKEKKYYKQMISFAGYNFFGATSFVFAQQGVNLLINIFFGVTINAARGITVQVESALSKFISDFTTALNPQITKSYAQGNLENLKQLLFFGSKVAFLLFLFLSTPIIIQTPIILKMWLGTIPEYTIIFVRLSLMDAMINSLSSPLTTSVMATGNIRKLSVYISVIRFMVFPLTWVAFMIIELPYLCYCILICCDFMLLFVRLFVSFSLLNFNKSEYVINVLFRLFIVALLSLLLAIVINNIIVVDNLLSLIIYTLLVCISTLCVSLFLGFNKKEKYNIFKFIITKCNIIVK